MIGTITLDKKEGINRKLNTDQTVIIFEAGPDPVLQDLLSSLFPHNPWGDRELAAKKLGRLRNPDAVQGLMEALQFDDFWMVRCAIIQALEKIGDNRAVPVLAAVAQQDSFQVVRSYASKAIERLS